MNGSSIPDRIRMKNNLYILKAQFQILFRKSVNEDRTSIVPIVDIFFIQFADSIRSGVRRYYEYRYDIQITRIRVLTNI